MEALLAETRPVETFFGGGCEGNVTVGRGAELALGMGEVGVQVANLGEKVAALASFATRSIAKQRARSQICENG